MSSVLIVNPSPRKGKTVAKSKRTPAQVRATKKMIAANKARAKGASAPAPKKRRASRSAPAKKRATSRRTHPITSMAEASRAGRKLRYRRPNPIGGDFINGTVIPSAIGAGGAVALDVLLAMLPLPVAMKTGPMAPVVKIAGALGLGALAGMVTNRRMANQVAAGAVTIALYQVARTGLAKMTGGRVPGLAEYVSGYPMVDMSGVEFAPTVPALSEYVDEYVDGDMGYPSAGMIVGDLQPDGSVEGWETGVYR